MLTDPQTITINAVAQTFNKISSNGQQSIYLTADGLFTLTVSHQKTKNRYRRMVRIDQKVIVADPLSAVNDYERLSVYTVIDEPEVGFSDADIALVVSGFFTWYNTTMVGKVLTGQS